MKFFVPAIFLRQMKTHRSFGRHFISNRSFDADITELNQEMESIFGEPPSGSAFDSTSVQVSQEMESVFGKHPSGNAVGSTSVQVSQLHPHVSISKEMESVVGHPLGSAPKTEVISSRSADDHPGLTHVDTSGHAQMVDVSWKQDSNVDTSGHAQMVDVSWKQDSKRVAVAGCRVLLGEKVFKMVASNQIAKGDVLTVAKIAGISGAKKSSSLIPLCHNIGLTHVRVDLSLNERDLSVEIEGEATTTAKTGVEMEALTAVAVASLTVYDMCKAASKDIQISELRLHSKAGGKSGSWSRKK